MSRSARWPCERAASEDVKMQVIHRLPGVRPGIDDHAEAGLPHPRCRRYTGGCEQQPAEECVMACLSGRNVGDVLARYEQHVERRLGVEIVESDQVRLIQDLAGWDL